MLKMFSMHYAFARVSGPFFGWPFRRIVLFGELCRNSFAASFIVFQFFRRFDKIVYNEDRLSVDWRVLQCKG